MATCFPRSSTVTLRRSSEESFGLRCVGLEKGGSISLSACAVLALWQNQVTLMLKQALVVPLLLVLHRPHKTWYKPPLDDSGQKCFSSYQ